MPADLSLLGQPVTVTFGAVGSSTNVAVSYSQTIYSLCGAGSAYAYCYYEINGLPAGGFSRQLDRRIALCGGDIDTLFALPSTGVTVSLGSPFTIRLTGTVLAVGNIGAVTYPFGGPPGVPYQPSVDATASADFSLGFPLVQDTGGATIQYTWIDCSSGQGVPLVPTSTLPPDIGIPSCLGDGALGSTSCPCANSSPAGSGAGCMNSASGAGKLRAQGHASLSADDVVLLATDMASTVCLFFQGTDGMTGVPFGDGLFCVGGTITRLSVQIAGAGSASMPAPGDSSLSIQGLLPAGAPTSRTYQVWYRDADPSFCTSATFNLSNSLLIDWMP